MICLADEPPFCYKTPINIEQSEVNFMNARVVEAALGQLHDAEFRLYFVEQYIPSMTDVFRAVVEERRAEYLAAVTEQRNAECRHGAVLPVPNRRSSRPFSVPPMPAITYIPRSRREIAVENKRKKEEMQSRQTMPAVPSARGR